MGDNGALMYNKMIAEIDRLIDACTPQLAADTIEFINIKSESGTPAPGAPFGQGPRAMLDAFLKKAEGEGLFPRDYGVGVVSAALKQGTPDLGIWLHGDVVPVGDGWRFSPYDAVEYEGCIIGRGATDNKGQLAAIFNLFKIFRALGVSLSYNPAIYLGSDEETGMRDMIGIAGNPDARGFLNVCETPRLSLVPDSGFPVGYGGKGSFTARLRAKLPLTHLSFSAEQPSTPGLAVAVVREGNVPDTLPGCEIKRGTGVEISAFCAPRHAAHPDGCGNAATRLAAALCSLDFLTDTECRILSFLHDTSLDVHGDMLGIATSHDIMGDLTVFQKCVDYRDGYVEQVVNIRYPLGITDGEIMERIGQAAARAHFEVVDAVCLNKPYLLDPNTDLVRCLAAAANEVTGEDKPPFTLSGGTYAHRLPNAYVYGMNGCKRPEGFPKDRGGAHGIDELVSLDRLKRAMKIYARALLRLDGMKW